MTINQLPKVTVFDEKGNQIKFQQYINETSGSGVIFEKDIRDVFLSWKDGDYFYADDYIAPISAEIIVGCAELNREMYEKVMAVIQEAYFCIANEMNPNFPHLTRIK